MITLCFIAMVFLDRQYPFTYSTLCILIASALGDPMVFLAECFLGSGCRRWCWCRSGAKIMPKPDAQEPERPSDRPDQSAELQKAKDDYLGPCGIRINDSEVIQTWFEGRRYRKIRGT